MKENKESSWYDGIEGLTLSQPLTFITCKQYDIDYDKVKTLDDVINIMKMLNVKFYYQPESIPEKLRPFLKECD